MRIEDRPSSSGPDDRHRTDSNFSFLAGPAVALVVLLEFGVDHIGLALCLAGRPRRVCSGRSTVKGLTQPHRRLPQTW